MIKHIIRFLSTLEILHIPLILWAGHNVSRSYDSLLTPIGGIIGVIMYIFLEAKTHRGMHVNPYSPFYKSHHEHHDDPTPETGVPKWWTFAFYFAFTYFLTYFQLPLIRGAWFSILIMLTTYEFIHFLCHCNYRPKTKLGWRIRINHLQHHNFDPMSRFEMLFPKKETKRR